jgi:transcriptional regulator with PAS, ATPase and Fis domain
MAHRDDHPLKDSKLSASAQLLGLSSVAHQLEGFRSYFPEVVGTSVGLMQVLETAFKVARSDSSVLILGESGTGKELIAAAIHRLSVRSDRPYVPLNCSAIPDNLLESDLFGHERGAFTGADRRRPGKFEYAEGGTIFLDEIGDMALTLQAKLLRVLQDKKFAPLGGNELKEVNVRIVAATNKDLIQAVKKGEFRLDLYYRLNVLPIHIPPLRERPEDIPPLISYFTEITNRSQISSSPCHLSEELIKHFCELSWPGNIRQLQNTLERLFVMKGGGVIRPQDVPKDLWRQFVIDLEEQKPSENKMLADFSWDHLSQKGFFERRVYPVPHSVETNKFSSLHSNTQGDKSLLQGELNSEKPSPEGIARGSLTTGSPDQEIFVPDQFGKLPPDGINLQEFIEELENSLILQALDRTGHNRNKAAKLLGLNRTTLVERIKKRRLVALNDPSKEL